MRLDTFLAQQSPEYSRSTWQKYIKKGFVLLGGKAEIQPNKQVSTDAIISINIPKDNSPALKKFPIIYKDENVIVINKPNGILTHSKGALNNEFTVADFFKKLTTYNSSTNRPGIVHRLDRDTSGIIIGALNESTATMLQKQFSQRKVKKLYTAIVDGIPKLPQAIIDLPIGRNPKIPSQFRIDPNGKAAQTEYKTLATNGLFSLVELRPITGRTHQLRVHMAHIGNPIHGDKIYGSKTSDRLYLHSTKLEITIPDSQRRIFECDVPFKLETLDKA